MNTGDFALFSQWKMQQQQYSTFSQQQQQNQNESQPRSSQQSFHLVDETKTMKKKRLSRARTLTYEKNEVKESGEDDDEGKTQKLNHMPKTKDEARKEL
ncbi:hypothetical protein Tco_0034331 [Tanacetum coccineum]